MLGTLAAAVALTAVAAPAAGAAESLTIVSGVMTYASASGQVDAIVMTDGGSNWAIRDDASPSGTVGAGCSVSGMSGVCAKSKVTSASLDTLDGDDSVTLTGAPPSVVHGGDGDDTISGGPAPDRLYGDAGNDTIDARDGLADVVDCGAGDDRAELDAIDTAVNCETVPVQAAAGTVAAPVTTATATPTWTTAPPVPQVPTTLPPVGPATILVPAAPVKVTSAGRAPLEIACGVDQAGGCSGVIYIDPAPSAKTGRAAPGAAFAARRGRFGSSPFRAAAGERATIGVRLSRAALRALGVAGKGNAHAARRGRRISAVVTVRSKKGGDQRAVVDLRG